MQALQALTCNERQATVKSRFRGRPPTGILGYEHIFVKSHNVKPPVGAVLRFLGCLLNLSGFKTAVDARRDERISGDVLQMYGEEILEVATTQMQ
jgi:hypothetical protein